ncbi:NADH-quinone oxidoreductase subunit NuoB [bacterium]|nr:NADH-quinone oxidoreductase subunit NuoB [bacterium]
MLKVFLERLRQGYRTSAYPLEEPKLPDRLRGLPVIDQAKCASGCEAGIESCPTSALGMKDGKLELDLGRCLFCGECERTLPDGAVRFTPDHKLSARRREDLVLRGQELALAGALEGEMHRVLGRSLKLRQVSAGGCNACEADVNVLTTIVFDLGRFGIQIVASPRHADGILVTGPVTENMKLALEKTYAAVPSPKVVIAVGACAISGGPYIGHPEVHGGAPSVVPVDLFIPGCPPHPMTILDGLLRLMGKIERKRAAEVVE